MGIVPSNRTARLAFYETHVTPWTDNATALGLTALQMNDLSVAVGNARQALTDALAAREASKAATENFYQMIAAAHKLGSGAIELIRYRAESTNDPSLWVLAQLPAPTPPSAVPPPGSPFDFRITLEQGGALGLSWKCNNPEGSVGTIYEVRRQAQGSGANDWSFVGASGVKNFLDTTLPSSLAATGINYQVVGVRSTARGVPSIFNVRFGVGGGGGFTVTQTAPTEVKLAA